MRSEILSEKGVMPKAQVNLAVAFVAVAVNSKGTQEAREKRMVSQNVSF